MGLFVALSPLSLSLSLSRFSFLYLAFLTHFTINLCAAVGPFMYAWVNAHAPGPVPNRADTLNNVWAINHWVAKNCSRLFSELGGSAPEVIADPEEGNWKLE